MKIGSSPGQTLIGSVDVKRMALETQQILTGPNGSEQRSLLVDAVEVSIQIDGHFANRVLQDSIEERLNDAFAAAGMDTTVASLLQSGLDYSPGASAQRIVDFSLSFFASFQLNHADLETQEQIADFAAMINGAIEAGFASAQNVLAGLGQIAPEVQAGIDETFELTIKGIENFVSEQTQLLMAEREEAAQNPVSAV